MLYLSGGGDENDSVKLDQVFAHSYKGKRLLYLPIALSGIASTYRECHAWFLSVFEPLGIDHVVMWDTLNHTLSNELKIFDAVYIGGGNTYTLLNELRKTGFDSALRDFVAAGGSIYGGSAGAVVLGYDIGTCSVMDSNDAGVDNTTGLGLVGHYAIWCHYSEAYDTLIANYDYPIIAIPERSGVSFDGEIINVVGFEDVAIFNRGSKKLLAPNEHYRVDI